MNNKIGRFNESDSSFLPAKPIICISATMILASLAMFIMFLSLITKLISLDLSNQLYNVATCVTMSSVVAHLVSVFGLPISIEIK
jgi:hypothetical protein